MKPESKSIQLLSVTRSKAKMYEYGVPTEFHIQIPKDPARLFNLSIGILGNLSAQINSDTVNEDELGKLHESLQFSARFFDSYIQARLNEEYEPYLLLLGSAAYYLCDLPGSSTVLVTRLGNICPDLEAGGLETLLYWLLKGDFSKKMSMKFGPYIEYISNIGDKMSNYFYNGKGQGLLIQNAQELRRNSYELGTPRELLFADIICAVIKKRITNSVWYCLPLYTDIDVGVWEDILRKNTTIKEFWPAQHLLGKHGIFRGGSGVVQMPTSAGKTKATEYILRSAFLSGRTSLTIIVAPFRALCNEISNSLSISFNNEGVNIDELSDVMQTDFKIDQFLVRKQILIVTPEKLLYVLRHYPELAKGIGVLIYDEGHQFDNGSRGITYELLLTSLKTMITDKIQTVLISAVISNADAVGNWLNGEENEVVAGGNLIPTYRTVAFTSWLDQRGRLEFVEQTDPERGEFFVPRIIEKYPLQLRDRERRERFFPDKTDSLSIALYFGIKLVSNGSIAIFGGTKLSISSMCEKIVEAFDRGLNLPIPVDYSDQDEISKLHFLYQCNLGGDAIYTQSVKLGVLTHHGNTPHGIRLSVEYAMKESKARFVISTSTLAQGVNLPIRYLIITSLYQGVRRIKVRDFHNLIGRTGRSGMHTEGSVIFADPIIYDQRRNRRSRWRWRQVKELLEPSNSEPCASSLLQIFEPLSSDDEEFILRTEILDFVKLYLENPNELISSLERIASRHGGKGFTKKGLIKQINNKLNIISSVESYLMTHGDDLGYEDNAISRLSEGTLAYFLANDDEKVKIVELFKLLSENIVKSVPVSTKRKAFGKTLYGLRTSLEIETWLSENIKSLTKCDTPNELVMVLWPVLIKYTENSIIEKCDQQDIMKKIAIDWIEGKAFFEMYNLIKEHDVRLISGEQRRNFKIDHLVEVCENVFAYDGTLIISALVELIELTKIEEADDVINNLKLLQKRLKYGLSTTLQILLYELGFADRVVCKELSSVFFMDIYLKNAMVEEIKQKEVSIREILKKYPSFFSMVYDNILAE